MKLELNVLGGYIYLTVTAKIGNSEYAFVVVIIKICQTIYILCHSNQLPSKFWCKNYVEDKVDRAVHNIQKIC